MRTVRDVDRQCSIPGTREAEGSFFRFFGGVVANSADMACKYIRIDAVHKAKRFTRELLGEEKVEL